MKQRRESRGRTAGIAGVTVLILTCVQLLAMAQTVQYVDATNGSDLNDGASPATPVASLQAAVDNSSSGALGLPSMIHVQPGTYDGVEITGLDHLTLQATSPGTVVQPLVGPSFAFDTCNDVVVDGIDSDQSLAQNENTKITESLNVTFRNANVLADDDEDDEDEDGDGENLCPCWNSMELADVQAYLAATGSICFDLSGTTCLVQPTAGLCNLSAGIDSPIFGTVCQYFLPGSPNIIRSQTIDPISAAACLDELRQVAGGLGVLCP